MTFLNLRTQLYRWLPLLLWAFVIYLISADSQPYQAIPKAWVEPSPLSRSMKVDGSELLGRITHAAEYALLTALAARAIVWKRKPEPASLLLALAFSLLYSLSDEFHQIFVPGRAFQLQDLSLDFIGALIGLAVFIFIRWRIKDV